MTANTIYENTKYSITTGKSIHEDKEIICYHITNIETGVIEAETTILPKAIEFAKGYEEMLVELDKDTAPRLASTH